MLDYNELKKKHEEANKQHESIRKSQKINFCVFLAGTGFFVGSSLFPPLFLASGPIFAGSFISALVFKKKDNNAHKQLFNLSVDFEKYKDQMKFLEELTNLVKEYYEPIFKEYNFEKEDQICKQIYLNSSEQMDSKVIENLKIQSNKLQESQNDNHYNILVLGKTGVGKSTLINVVLDLKGEKAAKENAVMPETGVRNEIDNLIEKTEIKKFTPVEYSSNNSSLILLDTRGIEISQNYNIDIATKDIKQFIEERNAIDSNPDKFIHCIWYLITGNRFEESEGNYLKILKGIYTTYGLPIIFVYTQAMREDIGDLIGQRIENIMGENINFIQIIARDITIKSRNSKCHNYESFGVFGKDELIEKSFNLAKLSIKSSYFNYMRNTLKEIFVVNINLNAWMKASDFIAKKIKEVIYEKRSLEELRISFENDFLEIIKFFLISEEIPEYTEKNKTLIKQFFDCFPNLKDTKLIQLIEKLKSKEIDKIIGNYMDLNIKAEEQYELKITQGKDDIKNMVANDIMNPLKEKIPYIALSIILLKYLEFLREKLYEILTRNFEESYKRIEDKVSEELKIIINKIYDNIMSRNWFKKEN